MEIIAPLEQDKVFVFCRSWNALAMTCAQHVLVVYTYNIRVIIIGKQGQHQLMTAQKCN